MRPLKLTMQAFGSYGKKTSIDFNETNQNLFLITGDTGAGKSTIFDAIVFAIYGEASSSSNKKDGAELQSQFVSFDTEPYVELTFSEVVGGEKMVYTVTRIPRHVRPLKKGSGVKDEKESVSLIMPDGSEYSQNQKETNKKLEEIVGLTKNQFMQVAMIAQGEFMELLRADSNKKKEIFRKLFHTGFYQDIVEELKKRQKEKQADMGKIRTACQTEIGHIVIPDEYENSEKMKEVKHKIIHSDKLNVADMEYLMNELRVLCEKLKEDKNIMEREHDACSKVRDQKRDEYTSAQTLLKSFVSLENAEKILNECEEEATKIKEVSKLIEEIATAYEIKTVYERYLDVENTVQDMEAKLKTQKEILPTLVDSFEKLKKEEKDAKAIQEKEFEIFTRVSERVKSALDVFAKISLAAKNLKASEKVLVQASETAAKAKKDLVELEQQEKIWRQQREEHADAHVLYEIWKSTWNESEQIVKEVDSLKKAKKDVDMQERKAYKAQQDYWNARQKYNAKNAEYIEKQNMFLDMQAGFLASEKLRDGLPCPVCGALEHPNPCKLSMEHKDLTREVLDELAKEVTDLSKDQNDKSVMAGSAADLFKEKQSNYAVNLQKLHDRMAKNIQNIPEEWNLEQAESLLINWIEELKATGRKLFDNYKTLVDVNNSLKGIEEKQQSLKNASEAAVQAEADARIKVASDKAGLEELYKQKDFDSEQDARMALASAESIKREKDKIYEAAHEKAVKAKTAKEEAETLISRYTNELPVQQKECAERKSFYIQMMTEKDLSEMEWKTLVEQHPKNVIKTYQDQVEDYRKKKASAEGAKNAALQTIGKQKKPDLETLEAAKKEAEDKLEEAQKKLQNLREQHKTNNEVYLALAPKMEERSRITQEFTRIDSLYNRLAGKVSGARMDIETFVQRYYLQRILYSANIRFQEMSAGQFELRMVGENQAGEGRNRGLDLMVYSTVTGKEREVRTLSGGESFMAALSLALGLADQIQESSASINLDIMFIDEGFGSLDEHSRNQAVKVLQQMANGSKLIGIISHVTELKQEIEDQLLVSKNEEGSHVKWQIS